MAASDKHSAMQKAGYHSLIPFNSAMKTGRMIARLKSSSSKTSTTFQDLTQDGRRGQQIPGSADNVAGDVVPSESPTSHKNCSSE